jgi:hypothetical protein
LLSGFGLAVIQDDDLARIAAGLSAEFAKEARLFKDVRIVTAQRR